MCALFKAVVQGVGSSAFCLFSFIETELEKNV